MSFDAYEHIERHRLTQGSIRIDNSSVTTTLPVIEMLPTQDATTYADWFACLAEPTRVRMLYAVATSPGGITVGALTELLGISQSTCSHHVRKLADVGFVLVHKEGKSTIVTVNQACCTGLPHAADVVMGVLTPGRAARPTSRPTSASARCSRPTGPRSGGSTPKASPPATPPSRPRSPTGAPWTRSGCPSTAGSPRSTVSSSAGRRSAGRPARDCYAGVGETSVYVGAALRGRGVGKTLLHRQVTAADDAGLWTLQTSVFPENRASLALHHSAGYRTLGVRERIARRHGVWRDTVFLERRSEVA